jgi:hypothetical protein
MVRTLAVPLVSGLFALSLAACDSTQSPLAPDKPVEASVYSPSGLGGGGTVRNFGGTNSYCTPNPVVGYTCSYGDYDNIYSWTSAGQGARVRVTTTYCGHTWVKEDDDAVDQNGALANMSVQAGTCGGSASSFHEIWHANGSYESFSSFE